jgi:hypothetical protein
MVSAESGGPVKKGRRGEQKPIGREVRSTVVRHYSSWWVIRSDGEYDSGKWAVVVAFV